MNTDLFNFGVENLLIQELHPGDTVIMDNATFHKLEKTKKIIEKANCNLIFLTAYSPDLNPIETFWANCKANVKTHINNFLHLLRQL